ncbi:MAG TPA: hypothetical protein VFY23_11130 [Candidatus Limnocylindrales bacterium]|nr:hypothetical protein [Candidatus Limnocylindrales bacterium]
MDTFVIRLWSPADPATQTDDGPRGVARHVGTGRAAPFRDGGELLALLRELPAPDGPADGSDAGGELDVTGERRSILE